MSDRGIRDGGGFDGWMTPDEVARLWMTTTEIQAVIDEVWEPTRPRHSVVLADAYLEHTMEETIRLARRSTLVRRNEMTDTYKRKTHWLFSANLIEDWLLDELDLMHDIRREFAHDWRPGLAFDTTSVSRKVDALRVPKLLEKTFGDTFRDPMQMWHGSFHICLHKLLIVKAKQGPPR